MIRIFIFSITLLFVTPVQGQLQTDLEVAFPNLSFSRPVDLQNAGDGSNRLFVLEQHQGQIQVFDNESTTESSTVFLALNRSTLSTGNEEGLLGLAFHPDYVNNGYFYIYYSMRSPRRSRISRFQVDPDNANQALMDSETIIMEVPQPYSNHNGGQLAFGPDGFLYIGLGDGGSGSDPDENGEDNKTLLGSILRIDVDNPDEELNYGIPADNPFADSTDGQRKEIFAYGLRNPWRFSFDSVTGQLWTGDVGQGSLEEIDIIEKGGNYGWDILEGTLCHEPRSGCDTTGRIPPIWEYGRSEGVSVTGGFVYRGTAHPLLVGKYIYADFGSGKIWALTYDGVNPAQNEELIASGPSISAFGVDENNELFILAFDGRIHRFSDVINVDVEPLDELPALQHAVAVFPNPFQSETTLSLWMHQPAQVQFSIYDALGRLVKPLASGTLQSGTHPFTWSAVDENGQSLPAGIYFYRLLLDEDAVETGSFVKLK